MRKRERTKRVEKKRRKAVARAPKGLVKITSPVQPGVEFMVAAELADDNLIERGLSGEVCRTMIYEYVDKNGKTIRGLSKVGVNETVRRMNRNPASGSKIRISPTLKPEVKEVERNGQKGLEVMAYGEDLITGGGAWGAKFEPYVSMGKNGQYTNTFAFEKALGKAQRNAMRQLIPEQAAIAILAKLAQLPGAVQRIEAPKTISVAVEPTPTDNGRMYEATFARISQIAKDKKKLNIALAAIENMPLNKDQKEQIRNVILDCLANL